MQTFAQSISGIVKEKSTNEPLPFAKITIADFNTGAICDENGSFKVQGNFPDDILIRVSLLGYKTLEQRINPSEDLIFYLEPVHINLNFDEVTISASKDELKRNSVSHVELQSLETINELPKATLGDMLETLPGVYNLSTGPGISKPVIRGLQGTRVVTLLNGTRMEGQQWGGDHGMGISELGIGTIEVLKGPASLQYGADALGGVLYLSNEEYSKQGHHDITASSMFESNTMGTINSLLYNGSTKGVNIMVGGRFASHADYQTPDGQFVTNTRFQDRSAKLALGWHKGRWVSNLRYDWASTILGIPGETEEETPSSSDFLSDKQVRKADLPQQFQANHIASWENKFILDKNTITLLTSFTMNKLMEFGDDESIPEMDMSTYNLPYKLNIESRLKYHFTINYGLQGMYLIQKNGATAEERLLPDATQTNNGLYFITSWKKNKWKLQGGVRGDMRSIDTPADFKFTEAFSKTYTGLNFSLGANYTISDKHILRINATSGYRIPHLSELLADGVHEGTFRYEKGDANLTTEKALQLDVAYEFKGEHLSLVVNPFISEIQDYIHIQQQDEYIEGVQVYQYKQSKSPVTQTGADLGVHWHPHFAHFLHIESTFSYLTIFAKNNDQFSLVPQPRWTNSIITRFSMKSKFKIDNVVLQYDYYLPQKEVSQFETPSVDFSLLDLGMQFSLDGPVPLKLKIGVRNLTNSSYINHLSRLKSFGVQNPGRSFYAKLILNLKYK